eukprot:166401_1
MMLFTFIWITAIISTSLSCLVSIDNIYLSNNTGDTIIIEATNSNPTDNLFNYPGWKVYINNIIFGQDELNYYGIGSGDPIEFTITSNTTTINPGERVSLHLELYSNLIRKLECRFNSIGTINTQNTSNMTTSIEYPYIICPATIKRLYTYDTTGNNLIIEISNDPSNNPNNDIFSYPSIIVYIVNNNNYRDYFGKSSDLYYGIGYYNQSFSVRSNNTATIPLDEQINLYIELYIQLPVYITACTFEWSGIIRVLNTTTSTEEPTTTTEQTEQSSTITSETSDTKIWCDDEDDTTSCKDKTCECLVGAQCKNDKCVGFGNPSAGMKQYVLGVVACMVVVLMIM